MDTNRASNPEALVLSERDPKDEAVAVVSMNQPAKRNALTGSMYEALCAAAERADADAGGGGEFDEIERLVGPGFQAIPRCAQGTRQPLGFA